MIIMKDEYDNEDVVDIFKEEPLEKTEEPKKITLSGIVISVRL